MRRDWRRLVASTVDLARALRSPIAVRLCSDPALPMIRAWIRGATGHELDQEEFIDLYAQTLACATTCMLLRRDVLCARPTRRWLLAGTDPMWQRIWSDCFFLVDASTTTAAAERGGAHAWPASTTEIVEDLAGKAAALAAADQHGELDPVAYLYESFLEAQDSKRRTAHGVFYTPPPIARYIIHEVDRSLRDEFQLAGGLADVSTWRQVVGRWGWAEELDAAALQSSFVRILDPALGSGVFLVEVIDRVRDQLVAEWARRGCGGDEIRRLWDRYVPEHLVPRLCGVELLLPACAVAHLTLVEKLAATGFSFRRPARLEIHLGNTLAAPARQARLFENDAAEVRRALAALAHVCRHARFTVVVGNPPFSGISRDRGRWISELLRGRCRGRTGWADYYEVDGRPLGERKVWLQDDYVKFMRFAHWKIEVAGSGLVGLIANHGYLDNPTFRGMRQQLLRTFARITVIDLHGNRKKKECAPDGRRDQNVFSIDQGTAIGLFRQPPGAEATGRVCHGELWGTAREKLRALATAAAPSSPGDTPPWSLTRLTPTGPDYLFVPRDAEAAGEYEQGYRLPDIMPIAVTAPVTARDAFVVALEREELLSRMREFRDLTIPDDAIRQRYFTRSRSTRYPPGDTRGWKLAEARRRMAGERAWRNPVRTCWYRPFDRRVIYWTDWMIDWPRSDVMRHMLAGDNLALVVRRQMLPSQPCTYFWIADDLALDGLIRSDNRGSESLFPVYRYEPQPDGTVQRRANYAERFVAAATRLLGWRWTADGPGDLEISFGPEDLACYSYALFFSPTYRRRYAAGLRSDFPRIFLPRSRELFRTLCRLGARLVENHLLRRPHAAVSRDAAFGDGWRVERGFPKYANGRVLVAECLAFDGVAPEVWSFHAGGHQVCRKWLRDRRDRALTGADAARYRQIVASIAETLQAMDQIDLAIRRHGGWPQAFASPDKPPS